MGQKSEPTGYDQIYVLGLDRFGNPCGARFSVLKDGIVSAAMDVNCRVLIRQPHAVSALAMRLPLGHVRGVGKLVTLFIPKIGRELYLAILEAAHASAQQERAAATTRPTVH